MARPKKSSEKKGPEPLAAVCVLSERHVQGRTPERLLDTLKACGKLVSDHVIAKHQLTAALCASSAVPEAPGVTFQWQVPAGTTAAVTASLNETWLALMTDIDQMGEEALLTAAGIVAPPPAAPAPPKPEERRKLRFRSDSDPHAPRK